MKNIVKSFRQKAEDALYVDSHIECKNCFPGWRWEAEISVVRESEGQKDILEVYRKTSAKWFSSDDIEFSDEEFFKVADWAMRLERDLNIDINLGAYNS